LKQIELLVERILAVKKEKKGNSPSLKGWQPQVDGVVTSPTEPQTTSPLCGTPPLEENLETTHSHEGNFDTTSLETQIDELVFGLYGLTREEISVITN